MMERGRSDRGVQNQDGGKLRRLKSDIGMGATNVISYTVQEGDSLLGIAMKHNMDAGALRKLNSLFGSSFIYPGQILLVHNNEVNNSLSPSTSKTSDIHTDTCTNKMDENDTENLGGAKVYEENLSEDNIESETDANWERVEEEDFVPLLEEVGVCTLDKENSNIMHTINGYLSVNIHYLAFRPIYSAHGKVDDKNNYKNYSKKIANSRNRSDDLSFRIDVADLRGCNKVLPRQYAGSILSPVKSDFIYIQLTWESVRLQLPLSSVFFRVSVANVDVVVEHIQQRIELYRHSSKRKSFYTSGSYLAAFSQADLKHYYLRFSEEQGESTIHPRASSNSAKAAAGAAESLSPLGRVREWFMSFPIPSKDNPEHGISEKDGRQQTEGTQTQTEGSKVRKVLKKIEPEHIEGPLFYERESRILDVPKYGEKMKIDLKYSLGLGLQSCSWHLVYDFESDGVALETLYKKVGNRAPSLMIIKTVSGDIFGTLCSDAWSVSKGRNFYGTGETFVFAFDKNDEFKLSVYRWTEKNNMFMSSSSQHLGVGAGGGGFAICIDSALDHGTTNPCETFGNEKPLITAKEDYDMSDNGFQIEAIEIFVFEATLTTKDCPGLGGTLYKGRRRASLFERKQDPPFRGNEVIQ